LGIRRARRGFEVGTTSRGGETGRRRNFSWKGAFTSQVRKGTISLVALFGAGEGRERGWRGGGSMLGAGGEGRFEPKKGRKRCVRYLHIVGKGERLPQALEET